MPDAVALLYHSRHFDFVPVISVFVRKHASSALVGMSQSVQ